MPGFHSSGKGSRTGRRGSTWQETSPRAKLQDHSDPCRGDSRTAVEARPVIADDGSAGLPRGVSLQSLPTTLAQSRMSLPVLPSALRSARKAWADISSGDDSDWGIDQTQQTSLDDRGNSPDTSKTASGSTCSTAHEGQASPCDLSPTTLLAESLSHRDGPAAWIVEVQAMSSRLRVLSSISPALPESRAVSTDVLGADVESWRSFAAQLEEMDNFHFLTQEAENAEDAAAAAAVLSVAECERVQGALAQVQAERRDAEERATREHRSKDETLRALIASLVSVEGDVVALSDRSRASQFKRDDALEAQRVLATRWVHEEQEACEALSTAFDVKRKGEDLLTIQKDLTVHRQRQADRAREFGQLQSTCDALRQELQCAPRSVKIETLESRVAQLEGESRELSLQLEVMVPPSPTPSLEEVLNRTQTCNRNLILDVRAARATKDEVAQLQEDLELEVAKLRGFVELDERSDVEIAVKQLAARRNQLEQKLQRIRDLLEGSRVAEELVQATRRHQRVVEERTRHISQLKLRAEEKATLLEWKMQPAVAKYRSSLGRYSARSLSSVD